jgi:hypothetical protein
MIGHNVSAEQLVDYMHNGVLLGEWVTDCNIDKLWWSTCGVDASPTACNFIFIRATFAARLLDLAPPRPGEEIHTHKVVATNLHYFVE